MGTYVLKSAAVTRAAICFFAIGLTALACAEESDKFYQLADPDQVLSIGSDTEQSFESEQEAVQSIESKDILTLKSLNDQDEAGVLEFSLNDLPEMTPNTDDAIDSDGEGRSTSEAIGLSIYANENGLTLEGPSYSTEIFYESPISQSVSESVAQSLLVALQQFPDFSDLEIEKKVWWWLPWIFRAATKYAAERLCRVTAPRQFQNQCFEGASRACGGRTRVRSSYVTCGSAILGRLGWDSRPKCVFQCR